MSTKTEPPGCKGRTRDGCWTCRERKKKCDSTECPCGNCKKLGLRCDRMMRLVWEEDHRRVGMKRRGAAKRAKGQPNESWASPITPQIPGNGFPDEYNNGSGSLAAKDPGAGHHLDTAFVSAEDCHDCEQPEDPVQHQEVSFHPSLESAETLLLDYYIGCFSRTYPTFSGPTNPFLTVILPIAMQSRMVLDSLLTVSGARIWDYGWSAMEQETLKVRQKALSGCRKVLERYNNANQRGVTESANPTGASTSTDPVLQHSAISPAENLDAADFLPLLTSATLFLLYDMLMGEQNFRPHLEFIDWLFRRHFMNFTNGTHKHPLSLEAVRFLYNCFLYNDLVRSTSLRVPTASDFYVRAASCISEDPFPTETIQDRQSRYYFPSLIARISAQDTTVTEKDIEAWNGRLDWLPSLSLGDFHGAKVDVETLNCRSATQETARWPEVSTAKESEYSRDRDIVSQLYRVTARIYRRQSFCDNLNSFEDVRPESSSLLASSAMRLVQQLSEGSAFDSALLWPIGICGTELTGDQIWERHYVILRLQQLEKRFRMKHFQRAQQVLANTWSRKDQEEAMHDSVMYANGRKKRLALDVILLG